MRDTHGLNALKPIDSLDDRREIMVLLSKLLPRERIDFLHWCASQANSQIRHNPLGGVCVYVKDTTEGHVAESYHDLMAMVVHFGLDIRHAVVELERRARSLLLPPGVSRTTRQS